MATHGAGPHWLAPDGSRVEGTVKARADASSAWAIPWLLLTTKSTGSPGMFARVTSSALEGSFDPLTDLLDSRSLNRNIAHEIELAKKGERGLAVLTVDVHAEGH